MGANHSTLSGHPHHPSSSDHPQPSQDSIPGSFEHHPVLKQYHIEQQLVPGSGRMMRTYRLRHKRKNVVCVCKSMWVSSDNSEDYRILKQQIKELKRIKRALYGHPHAATFDYYSASIPIVEEEMNDNDDDDDMDDDDTDDDDMDDYDNNMDNDDHYPSGRVGGSSGTAVGDSSNNSNSSSNNNTSAANNHKFSSALSTEKSKTTATAAETTTTAGGGGISAASKTTATAEGKPTTTAATASSTEATTTTTTTASSSSYHTTAFAAATANTNDNRPMYMENKYFVVYLMRSHVYTTLSDRLASRPFLTTIEKYYILYQMLRALDQMHSRGVVHGFLTTENIGLTSWNHVVFLDIASYKAHTSLPDDDPSEYLYYFHNNNHGRGSAETTTTTTAATAAATMTTSSTPSTPGMETAATTTGTETTSGTMTTTTGTTATGTTTTTSINREKRCYLAPERFISSSSTKKKERGHHNNNNKDNDSPTDKDLCSSNNTNQPPATTSTDTTVSSSKLLPSMDIFSIGCVIMEMFLNGDRALDLGELMEYRRLSSSSCSNDDDDNDDDDDEDNDDNADETTTTNSKVTPSIQQKLNKIESSTIRAMCKHMLHLHPKKRLTANQYLERLSVSNTIPIHVFTVLNDIIQCATTSIDGTRRKRRRRKNKKSSISNVMSPDARIAIAAINYGKVLWETIGIHDVNGIQYFENLLGTTMTMTTTHPKSSSPFHPKPFANKQQQQQEEEDSPQQSSPTTVQQQQQQDLFAETEALLKKLESINFDNNDDYDNDNNIDDYINSWGGMFATSSEKNDNKNKATTTTTTITKNDDNNNNAVAKHPQEDRSVLYKSSLLVYLQLILSNVRHVQRPTTKVIGLKLIEYLCYYSSDEIKLQRIVPIMISLLNDQDSLVRGYSIQVLTKTLSLLSTFPPSDSNIFPQYIFKHVTHLMTDPSLLVRLHFTKCIATLAEVSLRFLDISHTVRLYEAVESATSSSTTTITSSTKTGNSSGASSVETTAATSGGVGRHHTATATTGVFTDDVAKLLDQSSPSKNKTPSSSSSSSATNQTTTATATTSATGKEITKANRAAATTANVDTTEAGGAGRTLINSTYDAELSALHETVSRWVIHITTDQSEEQHSSPIKRVLLRDLDRLCIFFGFNGVMDFILPQILAFLNDRKDYLLRMALFMRLPSVCRIIGRAATEHFVLPCLETGLILDYTGDIEGKEQVISCALKCLSELIRFGLLSRSLLIGNNNNVVGDGFCDEDDNTNTNNNATSATRKTTTTNTTEQEGLLRKYSALLVHPSAEVRYNAILTMNASCLALGSPDSEVYVVYILRPFLRFQPSEHHLRTPEGMDMCLYPSWNRTRFEKELSEFVHIKPANHQHDDTVGRWTSVGVNNQSVVVDSIQQTATATTGTSNKAPYTNSFDSNNNNQGEGNNANINNKNKDVHSGLEDILDPQVERVREYLRMLGRNRKQSHRKTNILTQEASSRLMSSNGMEGSLKLAQKIKFPRQDTIGSMLRPVPGWYSNLRDKLRVEGTSIDAAGVVTSETCAIRSVSALGQVYGLSVMDTSDGKNSRERVVAEDIPKEDIIDGIEGADEDVNLTDEDIQHLVRSDESKAFQAVCSGEWGSETLLDPALLDTSLLVTKLKALKVPPLPPNLGGLNPVQTSKMSPPPPPPPVRTPGKDAVVGSADWKPKVDTLVASSSPVTGHTAPVIRIAVSLDQKFFVSGSYDGTCRVWEMPQLEKSVGVLESSTSYCHSNGSDPAIPLSRINDLAMVEGSHSVVSGASDGTVHVWRVDLMSSTKQPTFSTRTPVNNNDMRGFHYHSSRSRVVGTSVVRELDPSEGEVLAVSHFNLPSASMITFATQKGSVHSWDLRCCEEPFVLKHGPDIGYLTSMALGSDRNWVLTGTSRGYIALWDLRFHQAVKLWRHSRAAPVTRLATSFVPPPQVWGKRIYSPSDARPFVFASCGPNECAMFDVTSGSCRECFRTVSNYGGRSSTNVYVEDIPALEEVPISFSSYHRNSLMTKNYGFGTGFSNNYDSANKHPSPSPVTSINAMVGSIGATDQSYLITGGGDSSIRFWDFSVPSKCHVVSGHRPLFERVDFDGPCRLMLCRESKSPSFGNIGIGGLPQKLAAGLNTGISRHHSDAVQDLKIINNALISCSRDCTIKIWR